MRDEGGSLQDTGPALGRGGTCLVRQDPAIKIVVQIGPCNQLFFLTNKSFFPVRHSIRR